MAKRGTADNMGKRIAYSINEAAEATCINKYTIIDAIRDGNITARRIGERILVDAGSLEEWVSDQGAGATLVKVPSIGRLIGLRDHVLISQA